MPVSVVVVAYQSSSTIQACLSWLVGTLGEGDEVVVVDNGSSDDTLQICRSFESVDSRIKVTESGENLGYSKGVNLGVSHTTGDTLVFLNPDTEVYPGWLSRIERALDMENVGAVGPVSDVVSGDQFLGKCYSSGAEDHSCLAKDVSGEFDGQVAETKLLTGFCLAVRRQVFEEVGGLDENMVLGSDDLEFSWRLRLRGYRLLVCKDVFVRHVCGVSFKQLGSEAKNRLVRQSDLALLEKLKAHYGDLSDVSSQDLWGCDIFEPVLTEFKGEN